MEEKIKKILIFTIIIVGLFLVYDYSLAHPGNTASDGCHYCRTNCTSWGVAWNQRHCHGGGSYSPSYDVPSYSPPSIPSCPSMSYYDSVSSSCKCYSGYVASGGRCISTDQYCRDEFGFNARYDTLTDSCECSYGYVMSGSTCVSGDSLCRSKYGIYSSYDSLSEKCECDYGYVFNSFDQCVTRDDYCEDLYGFNAEYNTLTDSCECSYGYVLSGGRCIDGETSCHQQYGYNSSYNSLTETCACDYGYIFNSNDQCVSEDDYCQNLYGYYSEYSSLTDKCVCQSGYKFVDSECVTPEIFRIYPLRVEIGEEVTIQGENFGDSKYSDLNLYVGFIKINTFNILKWQDDKITFEIEDYLESGYVSLKGDFVDVRGSYLEILEPEEIPSIYYSAPEIIESVPELNIDFSKDSEVEIEPQLKSESKPESLQPVKVESQSEDSQQPEHEKKQELTNNKKQEKEEPKNSPWIFLANILNAVKEFFGQFFK